MNTTVSTEIVHNIRDHYTRNRGVGHTNAMLHGVDAKTIVLHANTDSIIGMASKLKAGDLPRFVNIHQPHALKGFSGQPLVLEHNVVQGLCKRIMELECELIRLRDSQLGVRKIS